MIGYINISLMETVFKTSADIILTSSTPLQNSEDKADEVIRIYKKFEKELFTEKTPAQ